MNSGEDESTRIKLPQSTETVATKIVNAAFKVHTTLGPGLLESVYETCLAYELEKAGCKVERQVILPIIYDGIIIESSLRMDMVVDNCVVVELKAVESLLPLHQAQLMTYLKLSNHHLGFLINFNVQTIRQGIKRVIL